MIEQISHHTCNIMPSIYACSLIPKLSAISQLLLSTDTAFRRYHLFIPILLCWLVILDQWNRRFVNSISSSFFLPLLFLPVDFQIWYKPSTDIRMQPPPPPSLYWEGWKSKTTTWSNTSALTFPTSRNQFCNLKICLHCVAAISQPLYVCD